MPEEEDEDRKPVDKMDLHLLAFFTKIIRTIFIGLFVGMANVFIGIYLGFGIPEQSTTGRLIGFYIFFGVTMLGYLYFVYRIWRDRFPKQ